MHCLQMLKLMTFCHKNYIVTASKKELRLADDMPVDQLVTRCGSSLLPKTCQLISWWQGVDSVCYRGHVSWLADDKVYPVCYPGQVSHWKSCQWSNIMNDDVLNIWWIKSPKTVTTVSPEASEPAKFKTKTVHAPKNFKKAPAPPRSLGVGVLGLLQHQLRLCNSGSGSDLSLILAPLLCTFWLRLQQKKMGASTSDFDTLRVTLRLAWGTTWQYIVIRQNGAFMIHRCRSGGYENKISYSHFILYYL